MKQHYESDRAEMSLLSGMLRYPSAIDDVSSIVREEMFRQDACLRLFSVLMDMHGRKPIDLLTVSEEFRRRGEWEETGAAWLASVWDRELTAGHSLHHAEIVRDAFLRRSLAAISTEIALESELPTKSALEAVEATERRLWELSEIGINGEVSDLNEDYGAILDHLDREPKDIDGLPTGFYDLDRILCGLQETQLIIVGARPATGKTAFGLTIMRHLAVDLGIPVFFASLEQAKRELAERLIAGKAQVDSQVLRRGRLTNGSVSQVADAVHLLREAPLHVDDSPCQTVQRIAANARRLARRHKIRAVFVDYLQMVYPEDKRLKRYEQVGLISRRLKILARELKIPVIALAQLNRGAEDHKEPRLSDLRDSGDIEQDADTVLLLHRPEEDSNVLDVIVAKHRNGPTGRIQLCFNRQCVSFVNMASPKETRW